MAKVRIIEGFDTVEVGSIHTLPGDIAKDLIDKGFAEAYNEGDELDNANESNKVIPSEIEPNDDTEQKEEKPEEPVKQTEQVEEKAETTEQKEEKQPLTTKEEKATKTTKGNK